MSGCPGRLGIDSGDGGDENLWEEDCCLCRAGEMGEFLWEWLVILQKSFGSE